MTARLPIRWKLTLWYAGLMAALLLLFSIGLFFGMRKLLFDAFDEQVTRQAAFALAAVRADSETLAIDPVTLAGLDDDEHIVRLIAADGSVVETIGGVDGVPLDPEQVSAALSGSTHRAWVTVDGHAFRLLTMPVASGGAVVGALQVALSREDPEETLQILLLALSLASPVMLALAAGGGFLLAGRALAPVAAITDLAARIDVDDLTARLGLDLPDDELGRLARTFDTMLGRIQEAFERQRRFTGDAAHELRTPLSLMRSQLDLALARPRREEEYREALRELDTDLERMTALVAALLTLARSDSGRLTLEQHRFDLAATIQALIEQYQPSAAGAGVAIVDESTPAPLTGDEGLLIQSLVNLLANALAHTPAGGRIAVGCRLDGEQVRAWVADSGEGIPSEHQAMVFDRFYRVDAGRTRGHGGAGLGLSISRAIVEAHGGTISLRSEAGSGTTVTLLLPATGRPGAAVAR